MASDALRDQVRRLFALLAEREIDYLLVGGIALLHYIDGRNTEDIDLIMALADLESLPELDLVSQDVNFARARYGDLQIDILLTRNRLFDWVRRRHSAALLFADREIPAATVEGLLLLKLYALPSLYRQGDFDRVSIYENDIAMLMYNYAPEMAFLLAELKPFISESDSAALAEIAAEIAERIARFRRGLG